MPRTSALVVGLALLLTACNKNGVDAQRVDALDKKLSALEQRLAKIEGFLGPYLNQAPPTPKVEADPAATYSVPVDGAPSRGPATAPVTIVKAFEFACGYCERNRATIDQLLKDYGGKVRVVFKHFVVHPDIATTPALASCAAAAQGKFDQLEELIWEKGFKAQDLSPEKIRDLAKEAKLDMNKFAAAMTGKECADRVAHDQAELSKFGVDGTPAFFINGRFLVGAQPVEVFKKVIDEELGKAEAAIANGTKPEDYYRVAVLEGGLKELAKPAETPAP